MNREKKEVNDCSDGSSNTFTQLQFANARCIGCAIDVCKGVQSVPAKLTPEIQGK